MQRVRLFKLLICVSILLLSNPCFADQSGRGVISISEEDLSPDTYPWQFRFPNGSLTDNGDGTTSFGYGGSDARYLILNQSTPQTTIGTFTFPNVVSSVATGTQPYAATSTTLNTNLNADLWDGYQFSDYLNQAVKTTSSPTFVGTTLSGMTAGSVLFAGTSGLVSQDNTNLFWNNTSKRLGIGTATPNNTFQVANLINFNDANWSMFIGFSAGANAANYAGGADQNMFIGYQAGAGTVPDVDIGDGILNLGVGYQALYANTTGTYNTAIGSGSLSQNTTGTLNVGIGLNSLVYNTTGSYNFGIGSQSCFNNKLGSYNIAIGANSLLGAFNATNASYNIAIGFQTLYGITTGNSNITIGYQSGYSITTGSNNIIFGSNVDLPAVSSSNMLSMNNLIYATGLTAYSTPTSTVSTGNVGIGVQAPSAALHLKAGTATASSAPLKLTSGTLLTTAEAGAMEFLTDKFYGTITTGAARKTFAFLESPTFTTPNIGTANASGSLTFTTVASGVVLKQGSNGKCGTFVANGATPVTISNTSVAITDTIVISLNTVGGTVGVQPHVATITAATGFTVICTALDSSIYNYAIISNAS